MGSCSGDGLWWAARLLVAALLGGAIGLERETLARPAGFRTHLLVCVGSALVMVVSIMIGEAYGTADPSRIAAQVVTGVGFLGAGTIMREGPTVRGLTTAASLWVVSALGLAVGAGLYWPAIVATAIVLATLLFLPRVERSFVKKRFATIGVRVDDRPGQLGKIGVVLGCHGLNIKNVEMVHEREGDLSITFYVKLLHGVDWEKLRTDILNIDGVRSFECQASGEVYG